MPEDFFIALVSFYAGGALVLASVWLSWWLTNNRSRQ